MVKKERNYSLGIFTGGVVGETGLKSESSELGGLGAGQDSVSDKGGVDNLGHNLSAGGSNDKSVFGRVVFILVLDD